MFFIILPKHLTFQKVKLSNQFFTPTQHLRKSTFQNSPALWPWSYWDAVLPSSLVVTQRLSLVWVYEAFHWQLVVWKITGEDR